MHRSAAEQMQMNVKYGLAGVAVGVEDRPKAAGQPSLLGERGGPSDQLAHDAIVARLDVVQRCDMPLRHDEDMGRRLRIDVVEGEDAVVLVDDRSRHLALDDLAEKAVAHDTLGN